MYFGRKYDGIRFFFFFPLNPELLEITNSLCRVNPPNSPRARWLWRFRIPPGNPEQPSPPPPQPLHPPPSPSQWESCCLILYWRILPRRWTRHRRAAELNKRRRLEQIYWFDIYKHPTWCGVHGVNPLFIAYKIKQEILFYFTLWNMNFCAVGSIFFIYICLYKYIYSFVE